MNHRPQAPTGPTWLAHLVSLVRETGGFTVDPRTGAVPTSGFAVNSGGTAVVVPAAAFFATDGADTLADYLRGRPGLLEERSTVLLGAWHHRGSDRIVISCVDRVPDRDHAVAIGAARGQTDVYDLAAGRLVSTGVVREGDG